jgi:hypothetical protein
MSAFFLLSGLAGLLCGACQQQQEREAAGPAIGVPLCDEFLSKFEACIDDHVPDQEQAALRRALKGHRQAWKGAPTNAAGRAGLLATCRHVTEVTKKKTEQYGCEW